MRAILAIVVVLAACEDDRRTPTKPLVTVDDGCKTADDCALSSYASADDCCGELCGERHAFSNSALQQLLIEREALCSRKDYDCDKAKCARLEYDQVAGCNAGRCVVVQVPRETQCTSDTDCVLTYEPRGECCGPKCGEWPALQAEHQADVAAHAAWRKAHCDLDDCPHAECVEADYRSEARCQAGTCVAEKLPL